MRDTVKAVVEVVAILLLLILTLWWLQPAPKPAPARAVFAERVRCFASAHPPPPLRACVRGALPSSRSDRVP
jgi:hypothetical protein